LAWVLVVASCLAAAGFAVALKTGAFSRIPWYVVAIFGAAAIWTMPLFWIVAITGRPPKYWWGFGSQHWQTK
jgi:hypothetical protein